MGDFECVVAVSAGHVYVSGTCDIVSIAADVLGMSVVRDIRGGGVVCELCMCLVRGGVGGEVVSG